LLRSRHVVLAFVASMALIAPTASAELPPNPVNEGDFYFSAGVSMDSFRTLDFEIRLSANECE